MIDLTGKSILLTGAASGIGAAAVRLMAGAGARVAGFDLAASDTELSITGDVTRADDLEAAVARGRGAASAGSTRTSPTPGCSSPAAATVRRRG